MSTRSQQVVLCELQTTLTKLPELCKHTLTRLVQQIDGHLLGQKSRLTEDRSLHKNMRQSAMFEVGLPPPAPPDVFDCRTCPLTNSISSRSRLLSCAVLSDDDRTASAWPSSFELSGPSGKTVDSEEVG